MSNKRPPLYRVLIACLSFGVVGTYLLVLAPLASAVIVTQSGDVNVTAVVPGVPPTIPAIIQSPVDGAQLATTPLVIQGSCQADMIVRVFNNSQLAGTITCDSFGQFTMNVTLQVGTNVLTALDYDFIDEPGPASSPVTVTVLPPVVVAAGQTPSGSNGANKPDTFETITGTVGDNSLTTGAQDPQRLFEGTVIEPVAQWLDFGTVVSPSVNTVISVATDGVFIVAVVALFGLVLL